MGFLECNLKVTKRRFARSYSIIINLEMSSNIATIDCIGRTIFARASPVAAFFHGNSITNKLMAQCPKFPRTI